MIEPPSRGVHVSGSHIRRSGVAAVDSHQPMVVAVLIRYGADGRW